MLVRHRAGVLHRIELAKEILAEAEKEVERQTNNLTKANNDLEEVNQALASLFEAD
jgi:hypothetical protein